MIRVEAGGGGEVEIGLLPERGGPDAAIVAVVMGEVEHLPVQLGVDALEVVLAEEERGRLPDADAIHPESDQAPERIHDMSRWASVGRSRRRGASPTWTGHRQAS